MSCKLIGVSTFKYLLLFIKFFTNQAVNDVFCFILCGFILFIASVSSIIALVAKNSLSFGFKGRHTCLSKNVLYKLFGNLLYLLRLTRKINF